MLSSRAVVYSVMFGILWRLGEFDWKRFAVILAGKRPIKDEFNNEIDCCCLVWLDGVDDDSRRLLVVFVAAYNGDSMQGLLSSVGKIDLAVRTPKANDNRRLCGRKPAVLRIERG